MYDRTPTATVLEMYYAELKRVGYSESEISHNRSYGNTLLRYADSKGIRMGYSQELGHGYLRERYDINPDALYGEIKNHQHQCRLRFCEKLSSFCKGEPFKYSYLQHDNYPLPEQFNIVVRAFFEHEANLTEKTVSTANHHYRAARQFLYFAVSRGANSCSNIDSTIVNEWVMSLANLRPATVKGYCSGLGMFFVWLNKSGYTSVDLSPNLPSVRLWRLSQIPSVWQENDLTKLLGSVDRGSPVGKRDYAILLLAAGLGLRASDIKMMKMENLKWRSEKGKSTIELTQYKTGQPISLPLLKTVGNALIDYLKNGRPYSDSPYVFLRHNAPFEPLGRESTMSAIINRYAKRAGIKLSSAAKHGIHSLRHTFASNLVANKTPTESIAGLLGHINTQSAHIYIKVDIEGLRECALSPSEVIPIEKS